MLRNHRLVLATLLLTGGFGIASAVAQSAGSDNRPAFVLVNRSSEVIARIQASPSTDNDWGTDLLGRLALPAGSSVVVTFPRNSVCEQDVRVTYLNNMAETRMRVNACATRELAFDGSNAQRPQQSDARPAR
ncbi:hypothetical protein M0638_26330 [Roseomonas sp. NAR14]|uniref:Uncharacterized protein n=1 Tax=Roseomonas acroporae TaxID=2937791 RepID=A0A9X1YKX9_9PROT|nr:hypothetical protein [Roseomonas acroporae]MCK8787876.1 hypothetical protein [Roseomonas acroporae]